MNVFIRRLVLAALAFPLIALATELPSKRFNLPLDPGARSLQTPLLNAEKALAEDANADKGSPLRYAIMHKVAVNALASDKYAIGRWTDVDAEYVLWRARIDAPGAVSIDLALKPFHLPEGAEVWLTDAKAQVLRGPYTAADNPKSREFWTPYVPGDIAYLEVLVPKARRDELELQIHSVQQAYRHIESGTSPFAKSGTCNVDSVCPQGDNHRSQINAVGRYSINGGLCTGQLINNTAQDRKRYFISASHCFNDQTGVGDQSAANTIVVYWKYESPTCRAVGSSGNGSVVPVSVSITQTGGATLRSTNRDSDTTLVELNTAIPQGADPFWYGWDRTTNVSPNGTVVHHPQGHEKRISFENEPLVESNVQLNANAVLGSRHWRINDWDVGTTEQGSSGSGLMNAQKRLIGVLSGGSAACGNNLEDFFGRLNFAWEGGGPGSSNVRTWLDPGNTGATALDGTGTCTPPTVAISLNTLNPIADNTLSLTTNISGGSGPYTLSWDLDNDGIEDRRATGVGASSTLVSRYPERTSTTVKVTATDASGCAGSGTLALNVRGPVLATTTNGAATQSCGDGDANVEPGEIWNVPVRVTNNGNDAVNDGFAVFTGGSVTALGSGPERTDSFGYRALASATSPACRVQAIDMSAATALTLTRGPHITSPGTTASDEGYVAGLAVGGASPFKFYDQTISTLLMSTNGYLSTNTADGGDDYSGICGVDQHQSVTDGRLQVLHDDLVVQAGGSLKHARFASCPRPSDVGSASQGCTVFEWRNLERFGTNGGAGNNVFQAVLYDESFEIVYQYLTADSVAGGMAVIGLQNSSESVRFNYTCDVANSAPANSATCFFHPSAAPGGLVSSPVHVISPAADLGNLAVAATRDSTVRAYVSPTAACGTRATVSYLGSVDDFTYSFAPTKVFDVSMPASGNCQVATQCAAQIQGFGSAPQPGGMHLNPTRSGNGQNLFNIGNVITSAWFTGKADRTPVWYLVNGSWNPAYAQATAAIQKVTRTSVAPFAVAVAVVGSSQFTRGDDDAVYINTYEIGGRWSADKLVRLYAPSAVPNPNHSGGWYSPGESGWGVVIDEHRINGQDATGVVSYIYDNANEPRWALSEAFNGTGALVQNVFLVHCPHCPNIEDFGTLPLPAGSLSPSYQSQTTGMLNTAITLPAPLGGSWNRNALPIQMLTPPQSPSP